MTPCSRAIGIVVATVLAAFLCAAEPAASGPVDKDGRPLIKKLGAIDINILENSPFVWKGRLYRMEWRHPDYFGVRMINCKSEDEYYAHARTCIVDHETNEVVAEPDTRGFILPTVFMEGDTIRIFATERIKRDHVDVWTSNDLRTWQQSRALDLPGWAVFNVSVCKAENQYGMSIEVTDPAEETGVPFTARFARSKDLKTWEVLPRECNYDWGRYTAPHLMRYLEGYYYVFMLENLPSGFPLNLVRSKDFIHWESSPFNPAMQASDEDKKIANPNLSPEKQQYIREGGYAKQADVNNSDLDYVEYQGRLVMNYGCGAQTYDYKFLAEAVYEGTEAQFLKGWFPDPAPYAEQYRPQFHFTYRKGWLSDINGLVFYKGEYHLFSQHCPATPECIYPATHWGHAVSTDLLHWQELLPAIAPDDKNGPVFSGSAVVDAKNTSGLQSGPDSVLVAVYSGARFILDDKQDGVVCMAYSNDRGRTWTKYDKNPILEAITHLNRDPKVFWHEPTQRWIMAITLSCGATNDGDYRFAIFSSPDLKTWREESRFDMPKGIDCPDMFELPVDGDPKNTRWVFWAGDGTHAIGAFDGKTFSMEGESRLPLFPWPENGANGYAAQTFNDLPHADGRCIQIAWLRHGTYPGMPFNQQASFPCELSLRTTPQGIALCRKPIREIDQLHGQKQQWADTTLAPGQNLLADVRGGLFDIRATFEPAATGRVAFQAYGVTIAYDAQTQTLVCPGRSVALAPINGRVALQFLVDRTSLEVFAQDGLVSASFCLLPPGPDAQLTLSTEGAPAKIVSLDVFDMKSIW